MSRRLSFIALVLVVGSLGAGVAASTRAPQPAATCNLPGTVVCGMSDSLCTPYGAICDTVQGVCVCASTDLGTDLGPVGDLGAADFATGDAGSSGGAGTGPVIGGGMTGPARSGCSFVPGSAR